MGGLFGVVSDSDCVADLYYGTDYHSHLGTKRGGMAVRNQHGFHRAIHNIENSYFRSKFEAELSRFHGRLGIGVISDTDPQPLIIGSHLGTFGIVTVGRINNMAELVEKAFARRSYFSGTSDGITNPTEVMAMLICQEDSFEAGIRAAQEAIHGSCSLLLLTKGGIYAARDRLGRTPLVAGRRPGATAISSETCAFPNLGFETTYFLGPGEILFMTADGWEQRRPPGKEMQICSFLWVYYGYPASEYEGINVEDVRYRCGAALARHDEVKVDLVAGIPDSGIGHAIGYASERKLPYSRPFVKYTPTWPRSFMPQNQAMRDLVAKMKLIPVRRLIAGQRLLFCDDSIVRGTQLKENVQILFDCGACEVHMRTACPTLIHPCEFLNFSSSRSTLDLAGRKVIKRLEGVEDKNLDEYAQAGSARNLAMIDAIRDQLHLTSLRYQTMDDLVAAIGLPRERLCTHCWDGSSHY
ncbi:amidophosphoribosyltransferase [Desulfoprunum benzoelyticum]|uniref:Amidophosphoribosyltransferase n=1 Tax=Desulfoprunum benzoelyticum TaxID=1506996 RepID=A0A840UQF0_9BACT|nr:amidophosphoribosyltransferase [Desulfoprunum benzoelyticum]MBB5347875.1 amidophosphoribosyltransferase [Desulfoprunum benzoelyticum]MBM9531745.1 amidophosphoribosyltransferase [Desulfoprunum benzoelyticum]